MKKLIATFMLLLALSLSSFSTLFSQNFQEQYQKALIKEEGEGSLLEAIDLYYQIVEDKNADLLLQAKALLHVGYCYEKLGRGEATKAYQRLVKNFPGQKSEVAIARERLSRLVQIAEKISNAPIKPNFRRIRTPFSIPQWSGSGLSPDGKTMAFGSGNAIWTVPIPGNVDPNLAGEPIKLEGASNVLGEGLSWSGDGHWIAFSRAYARDLRGGGTRINFRAEGAHIDVIPSSGGESKRIPVPQWVANKGDTQRQLSLSPDGKLVAFDSDGQIYVASVETGDIRQVTKNGGISPSFSPNGKKIAYLTPPIRQDNPPRRINEVWVISSEGENPIKVSGELNENLSSKRPTWSPDGRMIAFGRINMKEKLSSEVCLVSIPDQGSPIASPVQIKLPLFSRDFMIGWTPDNKIGLLLETPYHEYVYTVSVDGGKVKQVSPLNKLAGIPKWSPDGEQIYFRWTGGGLGSVSSEGGDVRVHNGLERLRNETGLFTIYPGAGNSVSPDGKFVVFSAGTANDGPNIYAIPVEGGEPKKITSGDRYRGYPCWSPDGKWIAYLAHESFDDEKYIAAIFKIPREGGEAQKITTASDNVTAGGFDWSPNGKTIAYFSKKSNTSAGTLNLVPIAGGESLEVCQIQNIIAHNNVSWSPNGKKIAFVSRGKIWVVQAQGGKPVLVKMDVDARAGMLDWSPDGKKIAFSGESGMETELWFMEDFLPLDKLAQNKKPEAAKETDGIVIKQVWTGSEVDDCGSISLDGKYLSFLDWETGDVAIRNLITGENERITNDGTWDEPYEYADLNIISPDGKKIACQWYSGNNSVLKLIDVKNKLTNTISTSNDGEIYPALWLSDQENIIAQRFSTIDNEVVSNLSGINVKTGKIILLRKFERKTFMSNVSLSPDKNYIAFDFLNSNNEDRFDINLLSIDGKEELSFIKHPANDRVLGWLPNRNEFLFTSDRSGTSDLWAVNTSNNNSYNEPKRIISNVGDINPMGFSKEGTLYYSTTLRNYNSYSVPFDQNSGELSLKSKIPLLGSIGDVSWLPDKESILCVEFKRKLNKRQNYKLCILNSNSGAKQILSNEINVMGPYRLAPDNKSILIYGLDEKRIEEKGYRGGIHIVDIKTGKLTEINVNKDALPSYSNEWSKDGKSIFYSSNNKIIKHDISTGKENIIYSGEYMRGTILRRSFDGNNLIFDIQVSDTVKQLKSISVNGGKDKVLCKLNTGSTSLMFKKLTLSPDGAYIYISVDDSEGGSILWRIPFEGGTPEEIWHSKNKIAGINIHPDGKQMLLSVYEQETEIRAIENLVNEVEKIFNQDE